MEPCSEAKVSSVEGGTQLAGVLCFEHCSIKPTEDSMHVLTGKSEMIHRINYAVHSQTSQSEMRRQNGNILLSVAQASSIGRLQVGFGRHGWCGAVVLGRAQKTEQRTKQSSHYEVSENCKGSQTQIISSRDTV